MCKLLVEKGADISILNNQGKSVTDFARKFKYPEIAELLVNEIRRVK